MKRRIATAFAVVAFAATGAVFACEYAPQNDAAAAPADASIKPQVAACTGDNCATVPDKPVALPKAAKKPLLITVKGPAALASSTSR
jgi:hypothetical protein